MLWGSWGTKGLVWAAPSASSDSSCPLCTGCRVLLLAGGRACSALANPCRRPQLLALPPRVLHSEPQAHAAVTPALPSSAPHQAVAGRADPGAAWDSSRGERRGQEEAPVSPPASAGMGEGDGVPRPAPGGQNSPGTRGDHRLWFTNKPHSNLWQRCLRVLQVG